jgi:DNA-binding transcriptional MerR regulator
MSNDEELDIREVSKLTGLPASTLRYYEEKGLIKSIGRQGLKRVFKKHVVEKLALISLGRNAGFSLEEMAAMFSPSGKAMLDREQLLDKASQLDITIQRLQAMRDGLKHVANCPEPNQLECPRFQTLVKKAAKTQLKQDRKNKFN